jgi:hypothetical protein
MEYNNYKYFVFSLIIMSEDVFEEDKAVDKILKDETLDKESTAYDVNEVQSDSNQADAEKDDTST